MSTSNKAKWIRLSVLALPLAGLLFAVSFLTGSTPGTMAQLPNADPQSVAQAISSTGWLLGFSVFAAGLLLVIFGNIALAAYLANGRYGGGALFAMVVSILAIALLLPFFGILIYALPTVGHAYLSGKQDAIELGNAIFRTSLGVASISGDLLYWVGFIVFGVAVWRSGMLPKWAAGPIAIHGLLIHGPLALVAIGGLPLLGALGGVLLAVAGGWIAWSIWQQPPAGAAEGGR